VIDTGSNPLWVSGYSNETSNTYNVCVGSLKNTCPNIADKNITYLDGRVALGGMLVKDQITIGGNATVDNFRFTHFDTEPQGFRLVSTHGILGMSLLLHEEFEELRYTLMEKVMNQYLFNPTPSPYMSYMIEAKETTGKLVLGGVDLNRLGSEVVWLDVTPYTRDNVGATASYNFWMAQLDGMYVDSADGSSSYSAAITANTQVLFDTGASNVGGFSCDFAYFPLTHTLAHPCNTNHRTFSRCN
jgi:hypothetical protein